MNKSFLQFSQPFLEQTYQKQRIEGYLQIQQIVAVLLSSYAIVRFISSIIFEETTTMYWEIGFFCYCALLTVLTFRGSPEKIKVAFTITNNLFCLLQIYSNNYGNKQRLYLNGQNVMVFNMIFFYFTSFQEAPFQIILFISSRLGIQGYINHFFVTQQFFEQVIIGIAIMFFIYCIDKTQRNQFLLSFTDKQWEQSLLVLIQNPFVLFTYDQERLNFNLKLQNQMEKIHWENTRTGSENLRSFLRNYKIGTDNLEQHIVHRIKNQSKLNFVKEIQRYQLRIKRIDADSEHQKQLITFSEFYLNQQIFLIVLDQHEQQIKTLEKVKISLISALNQHQTLTINFLKKQLSLIQLAVTSNSQIESLYKLKIHCMYFIGKYTQCNSFQEIEEQITNFNITALIKQMIQTYSIAYNTLNFQFSSDNEADINITTNENLTNIFLIILFQTFLRITRTNQIIFIHLQIMHSEDHDKIKISIFFPQVSELVKQLQNNTIFCKILNRITPSSEIKFKNEGILSFTILAAQFLLYIDLSQLNDIRVLEDEIQ